jgi:transposase
MGLQAYFLDLRQQLRRTYDQRLGSPRALAALVGVRQSFVEKRLRRARTTGEIAPRPHAGGRRALCNEVALAVVRRPVQAQPDATLAELCERLSAQRGLRLSVPTMGRLVIALSLPRKKSRSTPANRTPSASSRPGRPLERRPPRATPSASRTALQRVSISPCPTVRAPQGEGGVGAVPQNDGALLGDAHDRPAHRHVSDPGGS